MAKINTSLSNDFCPQSLFLYGNYEEDGTPHFGLFCWFGYAWVQEGEDGLGAMACIGEEKRTKDLIRRTGMFSANLVSESLLPLADYYGNVSGRETPDKMKLLPTVEQGRVLKVPTIVESPVSFELRVLEEKHLCAGSDLFICKVENVTIDQSLKEEGLSVVQRLKLAAPVMTVAQMRYLNFGGQDMGGWGEPSRKAKLR